MTIFLDTNAYSVVKRGVYLRLLSDAILTGMES